jgi:hypothetical protein
MSKLPLWDEIKATFRHFFGHLQPFEAAAWPWLAILALWKAAAVGLGLAASYPLVDQLAEAGWQSAAEIGVAVAWHRMILLGEPIAGRPRFGRAEWRFFVVGVVLSLAMALAFLPAVVAAIAGAESATIGGVELLGALGAAVVAVLAARCYLAFPGAAIGSPIDIDASWRRTRGNGWRIFWGVIGCAAPGSAAVFGWDSVTRAISPPGDLGYELASLVTAGLSLADAAILAGFLSFSYLWFDRPDRDAALH